MSNFEFSANGDIRLNYEKVGFIQGDKIYSSNHRQVGFIQGDKIYSSDHRQVGFIEGNMLYTADRRQVGPAVYPHPRWNAAAYFLLT